MNNKNKLFFILFVLSLYIYPDIRIFYPGGENFPKPFDNTFVFKSSSKCSLVIKDITLLNYLGEDILLDLKPFIKIDVSDKNFVLLDTFSTVPFKRNFVWYIESYEDGIIKRSNFLFFHTGEGNFFSSENNFFNENDYLHLIFKFFELAGYHPTGRVWFNGVEVDVKELDLGKIKEIRWKRKR